MTAVAHALLAWLICAAPAFGQAVGWRGDGTGRIPSADPPIEWDIDEGKNILWKVEVGPGQSSPVIVGGRAFVTAEPDLLVCVDLASGKVVWRQENGYGALPPGTKRTEKPPPTVAGCGYATPTPASDGRWVYACYGTGIVACSDLAGKRRWIRFVDLPQVTQYGRSVSPVLAGGKLLIGISGMTALDPQSGEILWHAAEAKPTYGTPVVTRIGDADVALTPGGDCVRLADGKLLARKLSSNTYTSPVVDASVVYYAGPPARAFRLREKTGETIQPQKLWENDEVEGESFASPLWHEGILYCASNAGNLYALDAASGKLLFKKALEIRSADPKRGAEPANIYPSLTLAGKHLLVGNDVGETLVLSPGRQYKEVARNYLDKGCGASPAVGADKLLLRGGANLYCVGRR
jgi:outer membrane protein assembly factor BamB